jgi:tetratricopeptide (TPR) repeat protein
MLSGEVDPPEDLFSYSNTEVVNSSSLNSLKGKGKAKSDNGSSTMQVIRQRHAEVIATLADVSLESESFSQAVEDYRNTLSLQAELLDPSDRRLAETHYKLALAIEYAGEEPLEQALEHLKKSHEVLLSRKTRLLSDQGQGCKEVLDIDELLPELSLKIDDVKHQIYIRDHPEADEASAVLAEDSKLGTSKLDSKTVPVNDLNSLIKKKPLNSIAAASSELETENTPKKRKLEESDSLIPKKSNTSPKKVRMTDD